MTHSGTFDLTNNIKMHNSAPTQRVVVARTPARNCRALWYDILIQLRRTHFLVLLLLDLYQNMVLNLSSATCSLSF